MTNKILTALFFMGLSCVVLLMGDAPSIKIIGGCIGFIGVCVFASAYLK
jgi:hypothetical protein